jgi:hypothetical protein
MLSRERYYKKMVNEDGESLYPTNCNMSSSNSHPWLMILHHELDFFYDTPWVCGCLKCKGLKTNPQHVTPFHYINDQLLIFDDLIPPTMVKDLKGDIENTCRDTSIWAFFEKLEAKSIGLHAKLANLYPFVELTGSSSEPKYDINITQKIYILWDPKCCMSWKK